MQRNTIKNYLELLNEETGRKFSVPPKIKENFKIAGNLSNIKKWKAKIVTGNSLEEGKKIGDWDEAGYILIGLNNNFLIPVARSDEHNAGHAILEYYKNRNLIPKGNYYSIFARGNNYIYYDNTNPKRTQKEIEEAKKAFKKFIEWGGDENLPVILYPYSGGKKFMGTTEDFLNDKLNPLNISEKNILPVGKRIIEKLEELARLFREYYLSKDEKRKEKIEKQILEKTDHFYNRILSSEVMFNLNSDFYKYKRWEKFKNKLKKIYNVKEIEKEIFGFNGLKNAIHRILKKTSKLPADEWDIQKEYYEKVFGNLKEALKEFDRISQI